MVLSGLKKNDDKTLDSIINSAIELAFEQGTKLEEPIEKPEEGNQTVKYDNRGRIISDNEESSNEGVDNTDTDWNTTEEVIEFGILDFNKCTVSTKKEWTIEDEKAGAFFIYNSTEDLSYSKIFLRDKETQEIIWISPLKDLPKEIKIENCKSRVVYMSSKAIFTENLQNTSGSYELYIADNEENAIEFTINDIRNNFEDIVVKYEENKTSYLINHILKYSNYEISRKDVDDTFNKYNSSIIIEKIGDKYSVLLNKPQNVINKVLFLRDNANSIYNDSNGSMEDILSTIQKTMDIRYGTTIEEFNDLDKLIITDKPSDIKEFNNLNIVCRKDVLVGALSKEVVLIDKDIDKTNIMLHDEQGKILTISVDYLNNDNIEELCSILNHKKIVMTGMTQEVSELEPVNEQSISMLLCNN